MDRRSDKDSYKANHVLKPLIKTSALNNGLNTKPFFMRLERKSSTNINFNTGSILSLKVKQQNTIFYLFSLDLSLLIISSQFTLAIFSKRLQFSSLFQEK